MKESNDQTKYCAFCESTEMLREFKSHYVCTVCIQEVKKKKNELKKEKYI